MTPQHLLQIGIDPQNSTCGAGKVPYNFESFSQIGVLEVWRKYEQLLSRGKGQILAILDDGCDLSAPQWRVQMPWGPKVVTSYNTIEGGTAPLALSTCVLRHTRRQSLFHEHYCFAA